MTTPVLQIRHAVSIAAALPQVGVVVYQDGWAPMLISERSWRSPDGEVWTRLCPDRFRAELGRSAPRPSPLIGPGIASARSSVGVRLVSDGDATIDQHGLFRVRPTDGRGVVGFVTGREIRLPCDSGTDRPSTLAVDRSLGTRTVGWWFEPGDDDAMAEAGTAAFDTLLAATVEEMVRWAGSE
ncbi:MAG: hypothetical protein AAGG08_08000 [Actinomycetota bacterium]